MIISYSIEGGKYSIFYIESEPLPRRRITSISHRVDTATGELCNAIQEGCMVLRESRRRWPIIISRVYPLLLDLNKAGQGSYTVIQMHTVAEMQ